MKALFRLIERIGHASIPVLLLGETGSGKEVVAEWVHGCSKRAGRPFLRINCAGLTEAVVESELFGHERGAFTGATQAHRGLFEAADGGTLLLDELAELPLRTQAKLLRVLEAGEFTRLGSNQTRRVSVRFIAATHRPLPELVASGAFRSDLYYRLNGARLEIPPLRERRQEIVPLAQYFLQRLVGASGAPHARLHPSAEHALLGHHWPGNVRELRNVVEYAAALCTDGLIHATLLDLEYSVGFEREAAFNLRAPSSTRVGTLTPAARGHLRQMLKSFERQCIDAALLRSEGNQTRAALELGISRRALTNKLTEHGIGRPRKSSPPHPSTGPALTAPVLAWQKGAERGL
jgi:DNA-binding NtrC family response regulator